ncbi:hypothetical protein [Motilibacter aurantiacus]|uniref:hypothetical protein n=1 Tax=Motilibacter aurantiacus TaxID=2714955 RepID=UPI00140B7315|nr:hypothetical protein [Motilibacter aurantiacus]NHC44712.1 hypothetical protein [Motilibacter aurantiacus]
MRTARTPAVTTPTPVQAPMPVPTPMPVLTPDATAVEEDDPPARGRTLTGPVTLLMAVGLLLVAWTAARGRDGDPIASTETVYWAGLGLIFVPVAARVLWARTPAPERLVLSLLLPLALFGTRALLYPTQFVFHDELAHANTLRVLQNTGHLFGNNALLPASSSYPGLEIATSAVEAVTGLPDRPAALVVLGLARLVMTLALIGVMARVTGSMRIACVAALIYTCNPQYLFFNSQYSYQTLSLPLALLTVYLIVDRRVPGWRGAAPAAAALGAVVVTHHLTAMLLVGALVLWCLLELVLRGRTSDSKVLAGLIGLGTLLVLAWALRPGNTVTHYLGEIAQSSANDVSSRVKGEESRQLFSDGSGETTPAWQQLALVASLGLLCAAILPALWHARAVWRLRAALALFLCAIGAAYPVIPAGHITPATSEVTDRASGFLFVGVGLLLGAWLVRRWRLSRWVPAAVAVVLVGVVFVGQTILGSGPRWSRVPGPYLVSADSRSVDADNIAAARWEARNLPPGERVLADRVGRLLAGAIGGHHPVTHLGDRIDASQVLLGPEFTDRDAELIREGRIAYVVIDLRDATGLPRIGVYYESGELGGEGRTEPVSRSALTKLAAVEGVQRVYDNGSIQIYDVRALRDAS